MFTKHTQTLRHHRPVFVNRRQNQEDINRQREGVTPRQIKQHKSITHPSFVTIHLKVQKMEHLPFESVQTPIIGPVLLEGEPQGVEFSVSFSKSVVCLIQSF